MSGEEVSDRPEFGDYPAGTEVFTAKFDAEDFQDPIWLDGREYPNGAIIKIRRSEKPHQGWLLRHRHLSQLERADLVFRLHADDDALDVLYDLNDDAYDEFVTAWDEDGGVTLGKSPRSSRRSKTTKRR
jgi:hypothetical protein